VKDLALNKIDKRMLDFNAATEEQLGDLGTLNTTDKTSLVKAANEIKSGLDTYKTDNDAKVGDLTQLDTTEKTSLVGAVNETVSQLAETTTDLEDRGINVRSFKDLETVDGDFSPVIQAALDSGYSIIEFPNWVKTLKTVVTVPNTVKEIRFNKAHLKFDKEQSAVGATYQESMFLIDGVNDLKVSGGKAEYLGTFDFGDSYSGMVSAFHVTNSNNLLFEKIEAFNFNRCGINIAPNSNGTDIYCKDITVDQCRLHHNRVAGLGHGNTENITILNNRFEYNGSPNDELTGYGMTGWSTANPKNSIVKGNFANYNYRKGIDYHAGYDGIIESNICKGNKTWGIFVQSLTEMGDWIIKNNIISDMTNDGLTQAINSTVLSVGCLEGQGATQGRSSFIIEGNTIKNIDQINGGFSNIFIIHADGLSNGTIIINNNIVHGKNINYLLNIPNTSTNKGVSFDITFESNHVTIDTVGSSPISITSTLNRIKKIKNNYIDFKTSVPSVIFRYSEGISGHIYSIEGNILKIPSFTDEFSNIFNLKVTNSERIFNNTINNLKIRDWDGKRYIHSGSGVPMTGHWIKGSIVFETTSITQGNYSTWVCETTGSPGAWRGAGQIA
jgi:Right handed beta helix region